MRLPFLSSLPQRQTRLDRFFGFAPDPVPRPGAFRDALNLSSDRFPLLSVRKKRAVYGAEEPSDFAFDGRVTHVLGLGDTLVVCTENKVYCKGQALSIPSLRPGEPRRRAVAFGADFFVVPDGVFVRLAGETPEVTELTLERNCGNAAVRAVYGTNEPVSAPDMWIAETAPIDPAAHPHWLDLSGGRMIHRAFSDGVWNDVGEVFMRVSAAGLGVGLSPGERVALDVYDPDVFSRRASFAVVKAEPDAILLTGDFIMGASLPSGATLSRVFPRFDFCLAHGNRLWGCRFGTDEFGAALNEIYASALGDPTKWYDFSGISTDPWVASVGCPGPFTGAAAVGQELVFFKEDALCRVTGFTPQDFGLTVAPGRGVKAGCEGSVASLNEKLYYLSSSGVTVYDGALPYVLDPVFSTADLSDVFAFSDGGKYLLSAKKDGKRLLFVYDAGAGVWEKEDCENGLGFCRFGSRTYLMTETDGAYALETPDENAPAALSPWGTALFLPKTREAPVRWFGETGSLTPPDPRCAFRRLTLALTLPENAVFSVSARAGVHGKWIRLGVIRRPFTGTAAFRLALPGADTLALRLEGKGACEVQSLTLTSEVLGEGRRCG